MVLGKVKVLFLSSNPPATQHLRLDIEIREIAEKIPGVVDVKIDIDFTTPRFL